jgi:hypothetical protein
MQNLQDPRMPRFRKELHADAFPRLLRKDERRKRNEIAIDGRWTVRCESDAPGVMRNAARDLARFLKEAMKVRLREGRAPARTITLRTGTAGTPEGFSITAEEDRVDINGNDARGAAQGAYYLERIMGLRGGPFLERGRMTRTPAFARRINRSFYGKTWEYADDADAYSDSYLQKLARFGFNGIHFYVSLYDLSVSKVLPELNRTGARKKLRDFKRLSGRAADYGIDLFLHINNPRLAKDATLFKKHPDMRGSTFFDEDHFIPCSSHPKVLAYYADAIANLFKDIPKLGGVILITGGECFLSCYTRPHVRTKKGTNCPRCGRRSAENVFADMVNRIATAVHQVKRDGEVIVWPYSAFRWSKDAYQLAYIRKLRKDVIVQSNFETNDFIVLDGVKSLTFDYNIVNIGPTERFHKQTLLCRRRGMKRYAKTESNVTLELCNVPYIPVMERWARRFEAMHREGVDGYQAQWRFTGFTGSLTEELLSMFQHEPVPSVDEALDALALKTFGTKAAPTARAAWKTFSKAWDHFPFSGYIGGGKDIYFRGPLYMGPAHPLIFDLHHTYEDHPGFYRIKPSMSELGQEAVVPGKYYSRLFVSDLTWTQPWGSRICLKYLKKVRAGWMKGMALYEKALKATAPSLREKAGKECAVAKMVGFILTTAINTLLFYTKRDRLFAASYADSRTLKRDIEELRRVAHGEIENARAALKALDVNYLLGYYAMGYFDIYATAYSRETIKEKICQVQHVADVELEEYLDLYLHHIFEENYDRKEPSP